MHIVYLRYLNVHNTFVYSVTLRYKDVNTVYRSISMLDQGFFYRSEEEVESDKASGVSRGRPEIPAVGCVWKQYRIFI
jgi:hypothetical protein